MNMKIIKPVMQVLFVFILIAGYIFTFIPASADVIKDLLDGVVSPTDKPVSFTPQLITTDNGVVIKEYNGYKLEYGLWYDPYTRIYTIGGKERVAEISNYPRAYKDTIAHVYTKDTLFTVTESDLNYYDSKGARFYQDSKGVLFTEKSTAIHYAGEPLPGSFPLWIEYKEVQPVDMLTMGYINTPKPMEIKSVVSVSDAVTVFDYAKISNVETAKNEYDAFFPENNKPQIVYVQYKRTLYNGE